MSWGAESPRRVRLMVAAGVCIIFLLGAVLGAAVSPLLGSAEIGATPGRERPPGPPGAPPNPSARLARDLGLSPEQEARVDSIFRSHRPRSEALFREMQAQLRLQFDSVNAAIAAVLTPEQRERFEERRARRREEMRRRFPDGAPRPGMFFSR